MDYSGTGGRALQNKKDIAGLMRTALRKSVAISTTCCSLSAGAFWQDLRQRALGAIPRGQHRSTIALRSAFVSGRPGARTPLRLSLAKRFELAAFTIEIGGALLAEGEYYLDHAAEHQVVVMNQIRANAWTSPAWQLVTIYYWGLLCGVGDHQVSRRFNLVY